MQRRHFLKLLICSATLALTPALAACSGPVPKPFVTGERVPAPAGCSDLRANNPEADC